MHESLERCASSPLFGMPIPGPPPAWTYQAGVLAQVGKTTRANRFHGNPRTPRRANARASSHALQLWPVVPGTCAQLTAHHCKEQMLSVY
jgi:hypothetical protein